MAASLHRTDSEDSRSLLSFALRHARKRRASSAAVADDDGTLLDVMISSAITKPREEEDAAAPVSPSRAPTATSQLMALLVAAIDRPEIVCADEAAADSSEDDGADAPEPDAPATPRGRRGANAAAGGSSSSGHQPSTPRTTTSHTPDVLPPALRAKARDPEALVVEVRTLLASGADANVRSQKEIVAANVMIRNQFGNDRGGRCNCKNYV